MAKSKSDLFADAQKAGLVAVDAEAGDFTSAQLEGLLGGDVVVHERVSASKPIVAPDGHVVLSQEDINNRA